MKEVALVIDQFCRNPYGSAVSYPRGLLGALSDLPRNDTRITLVGFNLSELSNTFPYLREYELLEIPLRGLPMYFDFRHFVIVPLVLRRYGFDAVIEMTQSIPFLFKKYKLGGLVTDASPLIYPRFYSHPLRTYLRHATLLRLAFGRCDRIAAISASTKDDIVRLYRIPKEKISLIPLGYDRSGFKEIDLESNYGVKGDFILSVGTFQPRKNYSLLIRAFDEILRSDDYHGISLVIIGELGWKYREIIDTYENAVHKDRIFLLHGIGDEELSNFYERCLFFVYPSLYEGFGLPLVEAMAFGKSVITSNVSSMAEFPVDEVFKINPTKKTELIDRMRVLINDEETRFEQEKKNLEIAGSYSWGNSARLFLDYINELLSGDSICPGGTPGEGCDIGTEVRTGNKFQFLKALIVSAFQKLFKSKYFFFEGVRLRYCASWYNWSWHNERSVEIPVVSHLMEGLDISNMLEVGNVLNHYGMTGHDVVDLYERAAGVFGEDIVSFSPSRKYDLVVSISTLEHVGWDEKERDPNKCLLALDKMFSLMKPGGKMIITVPLGLNPTIDTIVYKGDARFDRQLFMKRVSTGSWVQVEREDVMECRYDQESRIAMGIFIGVAKGDCV